MDTADKRFSMIAGGLAFRLVLPTPDTIIGTEDRLQLLFLYRGIAAGGGVTSAFPDPRGTIADAVQPTGLISDTVQPTGTITYE